MRLFRPGFLAVRIFREALFREKTGEKVLYLTFDDGPDIKSTIPLLNILANQNVRAVFFCSGKAASENPEIIKKIKSEGHLIGNHGYDHLDGICTSKHRYLSDISRAAGFTSDNLFRPPYGRLRTNQYRELKKSYRIVFWDLMAYDFDSKFGGEKSLSILKKMVRPGSVIALHDTQSSTVLEFLENFILFAAAEGYCFRLP
jgi:peptidoglycan-N-acetylglucosamine deacetylase